MYSDWTHQKTYNMLFSNSLGDICPVLEPIGSPHYPSFLLVRQPIETFCTRTSRFVRNHTSTMKITSFEDKERHFFKIRSESYKKRKATISRHNSFALVRELRKKTVHSNRKPWMTITERSTEEKGKRSEKTRVQDWLAFGSFASYYYRPHFKERWFYFSDQFGRLMSGSQTGRNLKHWPTNSGSS